MIIVITLLIVFLIILWFGITFFKISGKKDSEKFELLATAFTFAALFFFILFVILTMQYYQASGQAKTLNKMFGTNYTADDLFFSKELIVKTIEGQKYKIILENKK